IFHNIPYANSKIYVQLDRLAGGPAQERIRVNAMNLDAEAKLANDARTARRAAQGTAKTTRSSQLNDRLARPAPLPPSATNVPGVPRAPTPTPPAPTPPTPTPPAAR